MKTNVYVCGIGNVAFAATFLRSWYYTGPVSASLYYVADTASGCDFGPLRTMFRSGTGCIQWLEHTGRGGCNALWNQSVQHAYDHRASCCVILNDDIIAPKSGWLQQMAQVLHRNDHIAMAGIGSDSVWENEHRHRERWFNDPSLVVEAAEHCDAFRHRPANYSHHVSGPCWSCKPKLWLDAGGIPENLFWGWGEIVPSIELRKMGYQSAAVQFPVTILHYGGGSNYDIHSDPTRDESFNRRSGEMGDEGAFILAKYGNGHAHLMAQEFDAKLPNMKLPPIQYDPLELA